VSYDADRVMTQSRWPCV